MKHLCDSNVFLAIAVEQHAHHALASKWFGALPETDTALFCRATRISFLRLLTQKIAADYTPLTNREAWAALEQLMEDDATGFEAEPEGLERLWRQLSESDSHPLRFGWTPIWRPSPSPAACGWSPWIRISGTSNRKVSTCNCSSPDSLMKLQLKHKDDQSDAVEGVVDCFAGKSKPSADRTGGLHKGQLGRMAADYADSRRF